MVFSAKIAFADAVGDAFGMCASLKGTGLVTECEVKGYGSTVDVTIDTNGSDARKMCAGISDMMAKQIDTSSQSQLAARSRPNKPLEPTRSKQRASER